MGNLNRLKTVEEIEKVVKKQTFHKSISSRWSQRWILSNVQVTDESDANLNPSKM